MERMVRIAELSVLQSLCPSVVLLVNRPGERFYGNAWVLDREILRGG